MLLLWYADFFSKLTIKNNSFKNTIRVSIGLDQDQDGNCVGPDLGPNCLCYQDMTKVAASKERVKSV